MATTAEIREAQTVDKFTVSGVIPGDPVAMSMARDDAESKAVPEVKPVKLDPPSAGSFRFRTRVGLRQTVIPLRLFKEKEDMDENVKWKKVWERNAKRVWGDDWKTVLKIDRDLFEAEGIDQIMFRPIPGSMEASFQTRNRKIAAYVRQRIIEPEFAGIIYEEVAPMAVEINGEMVYVVPADDKARQAMAAAAAAGE